MALALEYMKHRRPQQETTLAEFFFLILFETIADARAHKRQIYRLSFCSFVVGADNRHMSVNARAQREAKTLNRHMKETNNIYSLTHYTSAPCVININAYTRTRKYFNK